MLTHGEPRIRRRHIWLQCGPTRGWHEFRAERHWVGAVVGEDLWEVEGHGEGEGDLDGHSM